MLGQSGTRRRVRNDGPSERGADDARAHAQVRRRGRPFRRQRGDHKTASRLAVHLSLIPAPRRAPLLLQFPADFDRHQLWRGYGPPIRRGLNATWAAIFSSSTKAPHPPGLSCSTNALSCALPRRWSSRKSILIPAGSNTIPRTCGTPHCRLRARRWPRWAARKRSPGSESPTSARRRSFGIARAASLSTTPSSGRIVAPPIVAPNLRAADTQPWSASARASCSTPTSRRPRSPGSSTTSPARATDATNASRTSLLDIHTGKWDEALIELFDAPPSMLPEVRDTAGPFGKTLAEHLGATLPVYAMAGDQQSALVGQVCLSPGMAKATYGTGGFILLNTGATPIRSQHGLLTTIAYQWDGVRCYALEGSIFFSAGATVQWLRDGLGIIATA